MDKTTNTATLDEKVLARIKKEMDAPRLAGSVRELGENFGRSSRKATIPNGGVMHRKAPAANGGPPRKLSKQEITAGLRDLAGWSLVRGNLHRLFEFRDFKQAFGFMKRVAQAADSMNHHPSWSNLYNKVTVDLSTHSAGGLTYNDLLMAGKMQKIHRQQAA
jgi:4a-hydroxytetrahydrobiopterin dehydratase